MHSLWGVTGKVFKKVNVLPDYINRSWIKNIGNVIQKLYVRIMVKFNSVTQ